MAFILLIMRNFTISIWTMSLVLFTFSCHGQNNDDNDYKSQKSRYETKIISNSFVSDGPTPVPPDSVFKLVKFKSEVGQLDGYLRSDLDTSKKYPAIVWAHGGFGGIGSWLWDYDSYIESYLNSEIVVFCPSWRGENENPGNFELFYGEVNDLCSAVAYVKSLSYVDTSRIYLAGHSTGGTLAILASLQNQDIRATFSFGGAPDIYNVVSDGFGYDNTPYDFRDKKESYLRSSINFIDDIKNPIFYFEGKKSFYVDDALLMEERALIKDKPFNAFIVPKGTHFNIVRPINELIIEKISVDSKENPSFEFSVKEIRKKMK